MNSTYQYYKTLFDKGVLDERKFVEMSTGLYNRSPENFSSDELDELEKSAKGIGMQFQRNLEDDENKIISAVNQLVSGVVEGFTTFGYADDPKTETEALLNKMGHLIGFAPDIIAGVLSFGTAPLAKRGALKGINLVRKQAADSVQENLGKFGAKYIPQLTKEVTEKVAGKEIKQLQLRSVPMRVADWFVDNAASAIGSTEILKNNFLLSKMTPGMLDMVKQSAHLSAAMAISSRKAAVSGDWEAVRQSVVHGAYAGAVFGGISNYLKIGEMFAAKEVGMSLRAHNILKGRALEMYKTMKGQGLSPGGVDIVNMVTRGIAGSAFTGAPLTVQGAPAPDQIYEYLLGFFFGASGRPKAELDVHKAFREDSHKIYKSVIIDKKTGQKENVPVGFAEDLTAWETFTPQQKEYAKQREAEIYENHKNTIFEPPAEGQERNDFIQAFLEISNKAYQELTPKERTEIQEKRNFNKFLSEQTKKVQEKLQVDFEKELANEMAARETMPDIDKSMLEVGDTIEVFTNFGGVEPVEVHKVFKNGNVRIKNESGQIFTLDKSIYITENLYDPTRKITKEQSEKFAGKEIGSLRKEDLQELKKELDAKQKDILQQVKDKTIEQEKAIDLLTSQNRISTMAREQSIRINDIPSDTLTAAREVAKDPKKLSTEYDKEIDIDNDTYLGDNDPVYTIVDALNQQYGEGYQTLDIAMQIKKAATKANDRDTFKQYVKTFYNKIPFSNEQLNEIYFNSSGKFVQNGKKFKAIRLAQDIVTKKFTAKNGETVEIEVEVPTIKYETEIGKAPKESLEGENLEVVHEGSFHNRLNKDSNFETYLNVKEHKGDFNRASKLQTKPTYLENISNLLHEEGRFLYYVNSGNNIGVTRPLVELSFGKQLLNKFMTETNQLFNRYEYQKNTSSFTDNFGKLERDISRLTGKGENVLMDLVNKGVYKDYYEALKDMPKYEEVIYESPFYKDPAKYYREKISRATYLLQDAGMIPKDLSKVTLEQWIKAFRRHQGYFVKNPDGYPIQKGAEPLYKNYIDFVKYSKTFHGGRTVDRELVDNYLQGRKLRVAVIEDFVNSAGEMTTDGAMHWVGKWRNALQEARGKNKNENYIKSVIQKEADFENDRGLIIFKQAERHASPELAKWAMDNGYDGVVYASSLKTNSRHQIGRLKYNEKTNSYIEEVKPEVIELEPEHIRIITSEIEVPNRDVTQMHYGAADARSPFVSPEFKAAHKQMVIDSISGSKTYMKKYNDAIKDFGYNFDTIDGKKIRISDLDLYEVVNVLNTNIDSKLGRSILKSIYGEKDGMMLDGTPSEMAKAEMKELNSINEILQMADYDALILMIHGNKKYIEQSITKYVRNRLTNLKAPSGFSYPRLQSQDAALWRKLRNQGLDESNFMLNDGHKTDKIKIFGQLRKVFKTKEVELGKLWETYNTTKDKETKSLLKDVMENFLMNRSPVGNQSGILNLTFNGFTNQPGKGVHVVPKNMERLGGADTDGDAVGVYHGLAKDFVKEFKPKDFVEKDKTDVNLFPEWGYQRNLEPYFVSDITKPNNIFRQADNVYTSNSNIGKSTNFNKDVRDLFTLIESSPDKKFPINNAENIFIRIVQNQDPDLKAPLPGKKKITLKSLKDHFEYFDNYESDISLNLDLDGAKNTRNPDVGDKFNSILERHFELVDNNNRVISWPRKGAKRNIDWFSFIGKETLTRVEAEVRNEYNKSKPKEKIRFINEKNDFREKIYSKNQFGEYYFLGKTMRITPNTKNLTNTLLKELFFLPEEKYYKMYTGGESRPELYKKYSDNINNKLNKLKNQSKRLFGEIIDINETDKEITLNFTPNETSPELMDIQSFKLQDLFNSKKISMTSIYGTLNDKLVSRRKFQKALEKGMNSDDVKGLRPNEIGQMANKFYEDFISDKSTGDLYNNHLAETAKIISEPFETSGYFNDTLTIDIQVVPQSQYTNLIVNLGKAHTKLRKTHFYNHLKNRGLLSKDLLLNEMYFDKIAGGDKKAADMSIKELKTLWDKILATNTHFRNEKNGKKLFQQVNQEEHILQQMLNIAALNNLALRYNDLRQSLYQSGVEVKMIDNKIAEMLDVAYDIKLNNFLHKKGLIESYDVDSKIQEYRNTKLNNIGSVELNAEQRGILSNIFSKTLLSNILPEPSSRIRESQYFDHLKSELEERFKLDPDYLDKQIEELNKIKSRLEPEMIQSERINSLQRFGRNALERVQSEINSGADEAAIYKSLNTLNMYATQQGMFDTGLIRKESIPLSHKKEFMTEIRNIFEAAETTNQNAIEVKVDLPKVKPMDNLKNQLELDFTSEDTRKRSSAVQLVKATLEGDITPLKREINKEDAKEAILFEKTELDDLLSTLKETKSQIEMQEVLESSILSKLSDKPIEQQKRFLENPQEMIEIFDITEGMKIPEGQLVLTTKQIESLQRWEKLIKKNPKLLIDMEGNIADFFSNIGIKGQARLGVEAGQMTAQELDVFLNMVEDIYVGPDSRLTDKIKLFEKLQGIKDASNPAEVEKAKNKSPFNRGVHYWFYSSVGLYQLQKQEMLSYQKTNVPVYDRITGETNLKSVISPTNTIELNVDVIDHGKRIVAALIDHENNRRSALFNFQSSGDSNIKKYNLELEHIATEFREAGYDNTNVNYDKFSKKYFDASFQRALKELEDIKKATGDKIVIKDPENPGNLKTITVEQYVFEINKARDAFFEWYKELNRRGMEKINGKWTISPSIQNNLLINGILNDGKVFKRIRNVLEKSNTIDSTAANVVGLNELNFILHHYQIRQQVNKDLGIDLQDIMEKRKPIPDAAKALIQKYNKERPFVPIQTITNIKDSVENYWPHLGFNKAAGNYKNIENHIKHLALEHRKNIELYGYKSFMPNTRAKFMQEDGTAGEMKKYIDMSVNEFITSKTHEMSVKSYEDTMFSERLINFNTNKMQAAFTNSSNKSRSEHVLLGYDKTNKILEDYTRGFVKAYTDTLSSIRGNMYIDRFIRKDAIGDKEHTESWGNYMKLSLNTKLGIDTFVDLNRDGFTAKEKVLLEDYIASGLKIEQLTKNRNSKLSYNEREFIRKVDETIAADSDLIYNSSLKGTELKTAIEKARMDAANKLNDVKNINKIKRYGTAFHVFSDEAAVNAIRRMEERIGSAMGYEPGQFSFFKDLKVRKSSITGEDVIMPESERRIALAQKLNAFSAFEGRYELMSLLFHPKTMIANFFGGGTNIYADVGGDIMRKAMDEKYLIEEVFGNATYEIIDPITRQVKKEKVKNLKDIERVFVQKGLMEGIYLEEVGLNKGLQSAEAKRFATALAKRFGKWEKENFELSMNPVEAERELKLSINELQKRYNVGEAIVQLGAKPMQISERILRRTAGIAHYLNARQTALPLIEKGKMDWDSPFLIDMARKGIEASQYIYHSAYRTNYSNTALGRVMTRFHPYAWNSIKRRRNLYKGAKYGEFILNTDAQQRFQRQLTSDLMAMALASIFVGTMFEYALSPPMSWMQDTAQWLFGDKEDRKRAFFSSWPHTSLAPLQVVTPPISRFVLAPISSLLTGEFDNFMKYQLATWIPGGRLLRDGYRSIKSPAMSFDFLTGIPLHRIGQEVEKNRQAVEEAMEEEMQGQVEE